MKRLDEEKRTDRLTELIGDGEKNLDGIMRKSSFQRQSSKQSNMLRVNTRQSNNSGGSKNSRASRRRGGFERKNSNISANAKSKI